MDIICRLFNRPESDNIAQTLGNMMLSGTESSGYSLVYKDLVAHQLNRNRTLVVFQDAVTEDKLSQLKAMVVSFGKKIYDISLSSAVSDLDILTAFGCPEDKAMFIVNLFDNVADISDTLRNKAYRIYYYAIDAFDNLDKRYNLKELAKIDPDYIISAVNASSLDAFEKGRRLRFLSDAKTYSDFLDIEAYMMQLESSGVCGVLSGDKSCADIFTDGNTVILSGYAREDKKRRELLLNAMLYAVNACAERVSLHPLSIILDNVGFMHYDVAKALLGYNAECDCVVYVLMKDISEYVRKNGNELIEKIKSFLIFNQGSDANATFWSLFFGSKDVQERSYSYTKRKSLNPFANVFDNGGVVANPRKYSSATTEIHKVNKPIYSSEIFRELRSEDVMCYLREPFFRRKSRIE